MIQEICKEIEHVYNTLETRHVNEYGPKLYIRIHKPTKHWYIGVTTDDIVLRHYKDIVQAVLFKEKGLRNDIYRKFVTVKEALEIFKLFKTNNTTLIGDWTISVVHIFNGNYKNIVNQIIYELTRSYLPRNLCMNTNNVYKHEENRQSTLFEFIQ